MSGIDEPRPLDAVLAVLDIEATGADTFIGTSLPQLHGRVYGGQVLAQAIIAAERTLEGELSRRLIHSLHGYFLRPGDLEAPIEFAVERLRDGGSFSARRTHALQGGRPILSMIASFQEIQEGVEHTEPMPQVPAPEDLPSSVALFDSIDHPVAKFFHRNGAFDIRHTGTPLFVSPAPERKPAQALWMRARGPIPGGQAEHRAVLAFACDQVMLEPVLRAHGVSWRSKGVSVASLDHAMWWHRDVDLNDWLLYVQDSPTAQGGRGLGLARVFSRDGRLVATIGQEGMVRLRAEGTGVAPERGQTGNTDSRGATEPS